MMMMIMMVVNDDGSILKTEYPLIHLLSFFFQMMPKYADFMFNTGLVDERQRDYVQVLTNSMALKIAQKQYLDTFKVGMIKY